MSTVYPTLTPRLPIFPRLLPLAPTPHIVPAPRGHRGIRLKCDLQRQLDDLSEEESEVEEMSNAIRSRGYNFLIPIGRTLTLQEEKNDADEEEEIEEEDVDAEVSNDGPEEDVVEYESGQDLDASMEDMDDAGDSGDNPEESDADPSSDM